MFRIKCFCGDRAPENGLNAAVTDCDINCIGDPSKTCGGEDRIQIYDLDSKYLLDYLIVGTMYTILIFLKKW